MLFENVVIKEPSGALKRTTSALDFIPNTIEASEINTRFADHQSRPRRFSELHPDFFKDARAVKQQLFRVFFTGADDHNARLPVVDRLRCGQKHRMRLAFFHRLSNHAFTIEAQIKPTFASA